jgi:predicted transposase YdaD
MGDWDGKVKNLANEAPQDFVQWLLKGAEFIDDLSPRFASRDIEADILYRIAIEHMLYLLHIEFQSTGHPIMAKRVWEYNVAASIKYKLPVYSFVIYLRPDSDIAQPPYEVRLHHGELAHCFWFRVIKLWTIPTEDLFQTGLKGLLPFVPLSREGKRREAVERVISELSQEEVEKQRELLSFTYGFASLIFNEESDQQWLRRRFGMLKDILKESWAFQEIAQEAREETRKEVLEGERQKKLKEERETLLFFIQMHFSALAQLAKDQCETLSDPEQVRELLHKVIAAKSEKEAKKYLLAVKKEKA